MDNSTASGFECPRCNSRELQLVLRIREHEGSRIVKLECLNIVEAVDSSGLVMGRVKCGEIWEDI